MPKTYHTALLIYIKSAYPRSQIDDAVDAQIVSIFLDPPVPDGFDLSNTEVVPGVTNAVTSLQVTMVMGGDGYHGDEHGHHFEDVSMWYNLQCAVLYFIYN